MTEFPFPAEHLRGGKLCRGDQLERDRMIVERYRNGLSQEEIAADFLVSRVTVWTAIKRCRGRIGLSQCARFREARRKEAYREART